MKYGVTWPVDAALQNKFCPYILFKLGSVGTRLDGSLAFNRIVPSSPTLDSDIIFFSVC